MHWWMTKIVMVEAAGVDNGGGSCCGSCGGGQNCCAGTIRMMKSGCHRGRHVFFFFDLWRASQARCDLSVSRPTWSPDLALSYGRSGSGTGSAQFVKFQPILFADECAGQHVVSGNELHRLS